MEQINSFIDTFTEIKENRLIDIIIALAIVIVSIMISSFFSKLTIKIFKLKEKDQKKIKENPLYKSIKWIFFLLGVYIAILILNLPADWFNACRTTIRILIIWNVAGIISNLIAPDSKVMRKIRETDKIHEDDTIIKIISKFGKIGTYVIAAFIIISELHFDISGLITGLGLTSVVIALAAQDLAESLISGAAIVSDKPFVVRRFC